MRILAADIPLKNGGMWQKMLLTGGRKFGTSLNVFSDSEWNEEA